ncbi:MAG: transporter substrate-binding domain-containing protein [Treponema sp.]|jgi:polar amino acid transport system substrate-binding protein|nr:transporter substrate-binding domain-containing protein [Treponema sp.]
MKNTMRALGLLMILTVAAGAVFAGGGKETAKITKLADLEGKVVAFVSSPQDPAMIRAFAEMQINVKFKDMFLYETSAAAIAAVKSNKVDAFLGPRITLYFYDSRNKDLMTLDAIPVGTTSMHMALRAADTELRDNINAALISMKNDGTLARLEREFISNLTPDRQLAGKDMPRFAGAPTLTVGLSGDLPPADYVAANGRPAGYNTELLALLSEKLQVNFEINVMPLESKFPALASGRIDIFFFQASNPDMEFTRRTMERNNNITLTEAYYEFADWGYLIRK